MSDMADAWAGYREMQQARRKIRLPKRQAAILALRGKGFDVVEKNDGYQFRVDGQLDLYPIHRRFHHLPSNTRGGYGNPLACAVEWLRGQAHV